MGDKTDYSLNWWFGCERKPGHPGCLNCYAQEYFRRFSITGKRRKTSKSTWKQAVKWDRWAAYDRRMLEIVTARGGPAMIVDVAEFADKQTMKKTGASLERLDKAGYLTFHGDSKGDSEGKILGYVSTGKPWRPPTVFPSMMDPFEDWDGPIVNARGERLWLPGRRDGHPVEMSDLRRDMFGVIDQCQNLDFILATKRPENIRRMWPCKDCGRTGEAPCLYHSKTAHRSNVHLLYSASDQESLNTGLPALLECQKLVAVLGLSLEPLLEPIDLVDWFGIGDIGRVIVGGESGPNARPCQLEWILGIVQQCEAAGVPCFVKQVGSNAQIWDKVADGLGGVTGGGGDVPYCTDHSKGGDPAEWPEELRVQQYPEVR